MKLAPEYNCFLAVAVFHLTWTTLRDVLFTKGAKVCLILNENKAVLAYIYMSLPIYAYKTSKGSIH